MAWMWNWISVHCVALFVIGLVNFGCGDSTAGVDTESASAPTNNVGVIDGGMGDMTWGAGGASQDPSIGDGSSRDNVAESEMASELGGGQMAQPPSFLSGRPVIHTSAPMDAHGQFNAVPEANDCDGPTLMYPENDTLFPQGLAGIDLQWNGERDTLYRVAVRSVGQAQVFYTREGSLRPAGPGWLAMQGVSAAGQPLFVNVSALEDGAAESCNGPAITIRFDSSPLRGAIYYWSTSDEGIMRLAAGDEAPERFLTTSAQMNCPACHALSRDGQKIAFTRTTFPPFGNLAISNVNDPTDLVFDPSPDTDGDGQPNLYPEGVVGFFPSFSPGGRHIIGGAAGQLVIRDASTGIETERLPLPDMLIGGSPDWSWQGDRIVATVGNSLTSGFGSLLGNFFGGGGAGAPPGLDVNMDDQGPINGRIAQWHRIEDTWSMPEILVDAVDMSSNDRPAYAPDGRFIAFNRTGPDPNQNNGQNEVSQLWIVDSNSGQAVPLERANQDSGLGNSWPKWAPDRGGARLWLAFSSLRNYGKVVLNDGRDEKVPQIWITAIDPDAPAGVDPSAPAFWLPFQDPESGNHIPYWAVYEKE